MALVSYSDSDASDEETPQTSSKQSSSDPGPTQTLTSFAVDKSNPRKIQVKLQETNVGVSNATDTTDGEPAPKRQRIGGGPFGGFNSLLPAPKRDKQIENGNSSAKGQPRKIFSLKTGAERGFDRDSDAELKQLFAEQHADVSSSDTRGTKNEPPNSILQSGFGGASASMVPKTGNLMIFKPLSVARKPQKKKSSISMANAANAAATKAKAPAPPAIEEVLKPKPKLSLFSTGGDPPSIAYSAAKTTEYKPLLHQAAEENGGESNPDFIGEGEHPGKPGYQTGHGELSAPAGPQSLDAIATDLNLSASARRQLFGRKSGVSNNAVNVINFNTDREYAANEVLRASGEQIQHNPVRAPASGKHSLKQLVSLAAGQKDALEESFAAGRQNKKEAGNRYGW